MKRRNNGKKKKKNSPLPRNIIRIPARQKAHQARNIARPTRAAQRDQILAELLDRLAFLGAFLLSHFLVDEVPHGGPDDSRRVRVDRDVVRREFHGVGAREPAHGVLGRAVVREQGEGFEGYDGGGGEEFSWLGLEGGVWVVGSGEDGFFIFSLFFLYSSYLDSPSCNCLAR